MSPDRGVEIPERLRLRTAEHESIDLDVDPLPIARQLWDESHGRSVNTADKAVSKANGQ